MLQKTKAPKVTKYKSYEFQNLQMAKMNQNATKHGKTPNKTVQGQCATSCTACLYSY